MLIILFVFIVAVVIVLVFIAVVVLIVLGDLRVIAFGPITEILLQPSWFMFCRLSMSCHFLLNIFADVH